MEATGKKKAKHGERLLMKIGHNLWTLKEWWPFRVGNLQHNGFHTLKIPKAQGHLGNTNFPHSDGIRHNAGSVFPIGLSSYCSDSSSRVLYEERVTGWTPGAWQSIPNARPSAASALYSIQQYCFTSCLPSYELWKLAIPSSEYQLIVAACNVQDVLWVSLSHAHNKCF